MARVTVTIDAEGTKAFAHSTAMRHMLDGLGFALTAASVQYSGVDTGALIGSMSHRVESDGETLVAICGSNAGVPGAEDKPIWYSWQHWFGTVPTEAVSYVETAKKADRVDRGPRKTGKTTKSPAQPYRKGAAVLGWELTEDSQ